MKNISIQNRNIHSYYTDIPEEWKLSKTVLIKKKSKPTVNELRPVALTNISYKIFIGILKCKIEDHIKNNNYMYDLQTGATKGRRVTENIFILQYFIDKKFKDNKKLYMGLP